MRVTNTDQLPDELVAEYLDPELGYSCTDPQLYALACEVHEYRKWKQTAGDMGILDLLDKLSALEGANEDLRGRIARVSNFPGPTYPIPHKEEDDFRHMRTRER